MQSPVRSNTPSRDSLLRTLCAFILICVVAAPAALAQDRLHVFKSNFYEIHTNLKKQEVIDVGRHMDRVFDQYQRKFSSFRSRRTGPMPLYLLRTQDDYLRFMASHGIQAQNSGGMFFVTSSISGLSTWAQDRSRSQTFEVLQHEGFHQFAFNYFGTELPIWANEGLAQYFEDGVIVGNTMRLGLANARRLAQVKRAIETGKAIPVDELLDITHQQWQSTLRLDPEQAASLYAHAWSFVFFLVHGDGGRYKDAFGGYLKLLSDGRDSGRAFRKAFGVEDLSPLESRWRRFVQAQEPDPLNAAKEKLEFLGTALSFIQEQNDPMPTSLDALRQYLRQRQFRLVRQNHGLNVEFTSLDETMYEFQRNNGSTGEFQLLAPTKNDLPPRLTAPGLRPEPTLIWSRNSDGELVQDIEYR